MIIYRVGNAAYAKDLTGNGAKLNGGRWNNISVPCIYTAESRALAVLEYSVNVPLSAILRALSITTIDTGRTSIQELSISDLPGDWMVSPAPSSVKELGSQLLKNMEAAIIKIPSIIIPEEFNYILNPAHPDAKNFRIADVKDFVYDIRIKK
jgi:RES domain-containing protein